jgi:hypothetical protein
LWPTDSTRHLPSSPCHVGGKGGVKIEPRVLKELHSEVCFVNRNRQGAEQKQDPTPLRFVGRSEWDWCIGGMKDVETQQWPCGKFKIIHMKGTPEKIEQWFQGLKIDASFISCRLFNFFQVFRGWYVPSIERLSWPQQCGKAEQNFPSHPMSILVRIRGNWRDCQPLTATNGTG